MEDKKEEVNEGKEEVNEGKEEVNEGKEEVNEGKEEVNEGKEEPDKIKEEHENKSKDPISNNMKCGTSKASISSRLFSMQKTCHNAIKSNLAISEAFKDNHAAYIEKVLEIPEALKDIKVQHLMESLKSLKMYPLPQLNYPIPKYNISTEFYQNSLDRKELTTIPLVDSNETQKEKDEEIHPFQKLMQTIEEINTKLGEIAETQRGILEELKKINIA